MNNLVLAKQKLLLTDLIEGEKRRVTGGLMVKVCPLCGHKDHFIIRDNNTFKSFGCGQNGSSVVDYISQKERISTKCAIVKTLELTGLNGEYDMKELQKMKRQNEAKKKIIKEQKEIIKRTYRTLARSYKVVKAIDNKDAFANWLMDFLDRYTNEFIKTTDHAKLMKLVRTFKSIFISEYNQFLKYEKQLNIFMNEIKVIKYKEAYNEKI